MGTGDGGMTLCTECHGNGVVYRFWKNDEQKLVMDDWQYCGRCYPDSTGYWEDPRWRRGWVEVDIKEFNRCHDELKYVSLTG